MNDNKTTLSAPGSESAIEAAQMLTIARSLKIRSNVRAGAVKACGCKHNDPPPNRS